MWRAAATNALHLVKLTAPQVVPVPPHALLHRGLSGSAHLYLPPLAKRHVLNGLPLRLDGSRGVPGACFFWGGDEKGEVQSLWC